MPRLLGRTSQARVENPKGSTAFRLGRSWRFAPWPTALREKENSQWSLIESALQAGHCLWELAMWKLCYSLAAAFPWHANCRVSCFISNGGPFLFDKFSFAKHFFAWQVSYRGSWRGGSCHVWSWVICQRTACCWTSKGPSCATSQQNPLRTCQKFWGTGGATWTCGLKNDHLAQDLVPGFHASESDGCATILDRFLHQNGFKNALEYDSAWADGCHDSTSRVVFGLWKFEHIRQYQACKTHCFGSKHHILSYIIIVGY